MSAVYDFTNLPAQVTITNNAPTEYMSDAGTPVSPDGHKYRINSRVVQFYKINNFFTLEPGASMKVVAMTSDEVKYFMSLADKDLAVEVVPYGLVADKNELNALLVTTFTLVEENYTAPTWTALESAKDAAMAVATDDGATPAEVKEALADLKEAVEGLELVG